MADEARSAKSKVDLGRLYGLLCLVFLIWLTYGYAAKAIVEHFGHGEMSTAGQFGDTFGALNTLFSAMAFAGLIFTAFLQRDELALQRKELGDTREVLLKQETQLRTQNANLRKQAVEHRVFQMLALHHQIVNAMDTRNEKNQVIEQARDVFREVYRDVATSYDGVLAEPQSPTFGFSQDEFAHIEPSLRDAEYVHLKSARGATIPEGAICCYLNEYIHRQSDFGHYFRNLYHIFKFIKSSELSESDQRYFAGIVRAQLSAFELAMLFYNALALHGYEKFKPLIEHFAILKNIDKALLLDVDHIRLYESGAYRISN